MKQVLFTLCVTLTVLLAASTFTAVKYSQAATKNYTLVKQLKSSSEAIQQKLDEVVSAQEEDQVAITNLNTQILKLRNNLSSANIELNNANQRVTELENQLQDERESSKRYAASVPKPIYQTDGSIYFPKVTGLNGGTILTNATYSTTFGIRVIFKLADGSRKPLFVDDLHPLVLQSLGINVDAARAKQRELDAQSTAMRQAELDANLKIQQAYAAQAIADANIAIQQKKAADEKAAKDAELETERIKANAAMVEAQKPAMQINVTQQQQQQQLQR